MNAAEINTLISAAVAAGSRYALLPEGNHTAERTLGSICIVAQSGVILKGVGPASKITLADGENGHIYGMTGVNGAGIEDVELDGNRVGNPGGGAHCIRGQDIDQCSVARVIARNAGAYNYGFQEGYIKNLRMSVIESWNSGADGIDFKNKVHQNVNNAIVDVLVDGIDADVGLQKAGIDCRGPVFIKRYTARNIPSGSDAIRFRQGEIGDVNGTGGHYSILDTFTFDLLAGASGIYNSAKWVKCRNGTINGGSIAIENLEQNAEMEDITGDGQTTHMLMSGTVTTYFGHYGRFKRLIALNPPSAAFQFNSVTNNSLEQHTANGADVNLSAGANNRVTGEARTGTNTSTGLTYDSLTDAALVAALVGSGITYSHAEVGQMLGGGVLDARVKVNLKGRDTWLRASAPLGTSAAVLAAQLVTMHSSFQTSLK